MDKPLFEGEKLLLWYKLNPPEVARVLDCWKNPKDDTWTYLISSKLHRKIGVYEWALMRLDPFLKEFYG